MHGQPVEDIPAILIAVWAILLVMVLIWFGAVTWLFRRLRNHHQATYESLGSPTLFWNNSPRNNWLFAKFLFGSQWKLLDDPVLNIVCPLMRAFLCVYLVAFLILLVAFIWSAPPRPRPHAAEDRSHSTTAIRSAQNACLATAASRNDVLGD
ncbi:MAG TPA: hypothetical protein VG055_02865 [Planctomycetaceae bacterium]|jgi:hypothetical protein|nr:hypothetical protein [Planctomycetaceae bacterium]